MPSGVEITTTIFDQPRPMCCAGCRAVAETIIASGHSDFYRHRTELSRTANTLVPEFLVDNRVFDNPSLQRRFVDELDDSIVETMLSIDGITCSACGWLIEQQLSKMPGVSFASLNFATHLLHVKWHKYQSKLSTIIDQLASIGFDAVPFQANEQAARLQKQYAVSLRRLVVAGIFGMQAMMLAVAMYLADGAMDARYETLFRWTSLALCIPILLYSAAPFFRAAANQIAARYPGMDTPVSVGIGLAFSASVWHTWQGSGDVYFDSVAMFTFLLLLARHIELVTRRKSQTGLLNPTGSVPEVASRREDTDAGGSSWQSVPVFELCVGDHVRVLRGQAVPCDGVLINASTCVDEALLTGESNPVVRSGGETLLAGSVIVGETAQIKVSAELKDSYLSQLQRLLARAQNEKPPAVQLADRVAGKFVFAVLLIGAAVALYWLHSGSNDWLAICIATLIVTCPCALSLATPTVMAAANGALSNSGVLPTRSRTVETLARATHVVFDKTGTLTSNELQLEHIELFNNCSRDEALNVAAALEQHALHPVARTLQSLACKQIAATNIAVKNTGVRGEIHGETWCVGSPDFVASNAGLSWVPGSSNSLSELGTTKVLLARSGVVVARFYFSQKLRQGSEALIAALVHSGKQVSILSGDCAEAVAPVAAELKIKSWQSNLAPRDKQSEITLLQSHGAVVAMIGDGSNDSLSLAAADVSIAVGSGTDIVRISADAILTGDSLKNVILAFSLSDQARCIIRQNIAWAIAYNTLALPLAAAGFVAPWMAAIGMSLSSLLVVVNSTRLLRVNRWS